LPLLRPVVAVVEVLRKLEAAELVELPLRFAGSGGPSSFLGSGVSATAPGSHWLDPYPLTRRADGDPGAVLVALHHRRQHLGEVLARGEVGVPRPRGEAKKPLFCHGEELGDVQGITVVPNLWVRRVSKRSYLREVADLVVMPPVDAGLRDHLRSWLHSLAKTQKLG
jgi:hypothetical protein